MKLSLLLKDGGVGRELIQAVMQCDPNIVIAP